MASPPITGTERLGEVRSSLRGRVGNSFRVRRKAKASWTKEAFRENKCKNMDKECCRSVDIFVSSARPPKTRVK